MKKDQDKGFTLVELLIVIVILGILATITVFAVRGITNQGQDSACASDQKTLQTAVEAYYAQYGTATDPSTANLVTSGLLAPGAAETNFTVVAGVVTPVAAPAGKCA